VVPTNYNNAGDFVTFSDTAATSTVYLVTTTLTPGSVTVTNNLLNYTFTGSGKLSGTTGLTKQGSGTLTIANSVANDFSGAITLTAGKLVFDQTIDATVANSISGAGTLVQSGGNFLTLSGINSFTGGLVVDTGVVRATSTTAPGNTTVTVYSRGTLSPGNTNQHLYSRRWRFWCREWRDEQCSWRTHRRGRLYLHALHCRSAKLGCGRRYGSFLHEYLARER